MIVQKKQGAICQALLCDTPFHLNGVLGDPLKSMEVTQGRVLLGC